MKRDPPSIRSVHSEEAEGLIREGRVRVLDVRTPEEYRDLGHIPGAILLPVELVAAGLATLPRDGTPLLVCCEHGIRSAAAARLLERGGVPSPLNLQGGLSRWSGPRDFSPGEPFGPFGPSAWLVLNADLLSGAGQALDLACGAGRNALLLAKAGISVRAVDHDSRKIGDLREMARRLELPLEAEVLDLEAGDPDLGLECFDLILGIHYLHRPLFPSLRRALAPGGILLYETFTRDQALRGKPTNPDFLLSEGELPRLVHPLRILRSREGEFERRMISAVAARKE
jgi:tellurite methyltransferase